jgi:hypothetical protein
VLDIAGPARLRGNLGRIPSYAPFNRQMADWKFHLFPARNAHNLWPIISTIYSTGFRNRVSSSSGLLDFNLFSGDCPCHVAFDESGQIDFTDFFLACCFNSFVRPVLLDYHFRHERDSLMTQANPLHRMAALLRLLAVRESRAGRHRRRSCWEAAIAHSTYDMVLAGLAIFALRANGAPHQ